MSKKNSFIFIFIFVLGVSISLGFRALYVRAINNITFKTQNSSFKLEPPSSSLKGELVYIKGEVKKLSRNEEEFKEMEKGQKILQGEAISVGELSYAVVNFENFGEISINSKSEVSFVDLLPSEFLVRQDSGFVSYEVKDGLDKKISVRSLHALFEISGKLDIEIKGGIISVDNILGKTRIGMVDLENQTQVLELQKGQKALVNDNNRTLTRISN